MAAQRHAYGASGEPGLAELASRQHGVVSRAQLRELGFGRQAIARRLAAQRLRLLYPRVYAVGHWALTRESGDLAAVFACGRGALLSHRAAARRHRLLRDVRIELTARRGVKSKPGIVVHTTRFVHPEDAALVDGIPTTSVARTLVDLADVLPDRRLATAVNEAEVRRVFDLAAIERTLDRLPGRRGRARLLRVLAAYTEPLPYTTSEAERRFLDLCEGHHLPRPQRVTLAGYELDFYWPDARLAVEVDGGAFHRTRRAFHEDRRRDRRLAAEGIQVARIPWVDLTGAVEALAAELRAIRRARLA